MPEGAAARRRLREAALQGFVALPGGTGTPAAGDPEPVQTPEGTLSYFLVPDRREGMVVAVARVFPDGRVAGVLRPTVPAPDCAAVVTGVAAGPLRALADEIARREGATVVGEPRLVHDGPVGREAWLLTLALPGGSQRWVFATAGGSYTRRPGEPPRGGIV